MRIRWRHFVLLGAMLAPAACAQPEVLRRPLPAPEMEGPPLAGAPLPSLARPTGGPRIELPPPAEEAVLN